MDTELIIATMESDFDALIKQYNAAADREYYLALGAPDAPKTALHLRDMEMHERMARLYRQMKERCVTFVDAYAADAEK